MAELTAKARKLLGEPNIARVATLTKDGSPQVTPVWIGGDGDYVVFKTHEARRGARQRPDRADFRRGDTMTIEENRENG